MKPREARYWIILYYLCYENTCGRDQSAFEEYVMSGWKNIRRKSHHPGEKLWHSEISQSKNIWAFNFNILLQN